MFSKKKPEGTEDQLHNLMNLGGFGGLQRKSSPGTSQQGPLRFEEVVKKHGVDLMLIVERVNNPHLKKFYQQDPQCFTRIANEVFIAIEGFNQNLVNGVDKETDFDLAKTQEILRASKAYKKEDERHVLCCILPVAFSLIVAEHKVPQNRLPIYASLQKGFEQAIIGRTEEPEDLKQNFEPVAEKHEHLDLKEVEKRFEQLIDIMKSEFAETRQAKEVIAFMEKQKTNPNVLKAVDLILQSYVELGQLDENGIREFLKIKDQVAHFIHSTKDWEQRKILETVVFPVATVTAISMVHGLTEQMNLSEEYRLKLRDRFQELTEEYRELAEDKDEPSHDILNEMQQILADNPDQDPMELLMKHIDSKFKSQS